MLNKELILSKKREKRLSYRYMAKRLGYSNGSGVWKLIKGDHELKAKYIETLAEILDLQISELFVTPTDGGDAE